MAKGLPKGWKPTGKQLGEGGQARVHLVTKEGTTDDRYFALKVLKTNLPPKALQRFYTEIAAVKRIRHPNVIEICEHSQEREEPAYYVMEYLDGAQSLRQLITSERNPFYGNPEGSMRMFIALLEVLKCCDDAKIIHRDLSHANVLVLPNSTIKVIDFGLCQIDDGHLVTLTDENVGTPNYLAPECESFAESEITIRSDFYSAGKILWSAMTNRNAFSRESKVFNDLSMQKLFPANEQAWHLQHVFAATIRNNPKDRWQSVEQALGEAWRVLRLMQQRAIPIDKLASNVCPVCRYGTLRAPENVFNAGGYLLFGQAHPQGVVRLVCNYCGQCHLVHRKLQKENIEAMQKLS
jgi:serine/threonine protein kinase